MNTLLTQPVATLLARLFGDADLAWSADSPSSRYWEGLTAEEQNQLVRSKTQYREFYSRLKDAPLSVSRNTARMLYMLARSNRASHIVEFGTSIGLSTLHLAAALKDNGGGKLISTEFEPAKVQLARQHLAESGLAGLVEIRQGDALQTLSAGLPIAIDILFLDGAKGLYLDILALVKRRLRPGALIIADDADFCPDYLEVVRSSPAEFMSTAFDDGCEISTYLG
ncbi:O-methyltransferase (plasmid) [Sodalis praecaptivus]|uniref:O-methyltransferase n=1 Tax=Sodalis praecaptivus TaxID=1239307 RepID=W0HZF9_9GAMM|nr:class I SAM-dependent methyltransferase [Sodalis praecaptivus]AHF79159.1 O-methyltransferase [Sodalis praecaptivus]